MNSFLDPKKFIFENDIIIKNTASQEKNKVSDDSSDMSSSSSNNNNIHEQNLNLHPQYILGLQLMNLEMEEFHAEIR